MADLSFDDLVPSGPPGGALSFDDLVPAGEAMPGVLEAAMQGAKAGTAQIGQTAETLQGKTPTASAETSPAAQPFAWSDLTSPIASGAPKAAYRLAESYPSLAGGIAGGAIGSIGGATVAGPVGATVGGIGGGAIGAATASAAQTLGPSFAAELKKTPDDPDAAYARAMRSAEISGAFGGASWALFPVRFFQGPVKNLLFQAFAVQPGVSVAQRATQNVAAGNPAGEGLGEAYTEGAVGTAVPMLGHAAISRGVAAARGNAPEGVSPAQSAATSRVQDILANGPEDYLRSGVQEPQTVPESPATLQAQQDQLVAGERAAQMFPRGTPELSTPEGAQRVETPSGDVFHYDPSQIAPDAISQASAAGRENDVLGLGPYSKDDVAQQVAAGEQPLAVTERAPDGTEVRAAAGTESTLPEQAAALEQGKTPGNTVAAEPLENVLSGRQANGQNTRQPLSISQYIARNGGLELTPDARAMDLHKVFVPRGGPLARPKGKSIDGFWRTRLVEAGYLPPEADGYSSRDMRDEVMGAVSRDLAGQRVYSVHDEDLMGNLPPSSADEYTQGVQQAADQILKAHGATYDQIGPKTLYDAAEILYRGEAKDASEALDYAAQAHAEALQRDSGQVGAAGEQGEGRGPQDRSAGFGADASDNGARRGPKDDIENFYSLGAGEKRSPVAEAQPSQEYQKALAKANEAERVFRPFTDAYRARKIGDAEYFAARKVRDAAAAEFDAAYAAEQARKPTTETVTLDKGVKGNQYVIPGAERIGQGEQAQRRANESLKPKVAQKAADFGLFGSDKDQGSLFSIRSYDNVPDALMGFRRNGANRAYQDQNYRHEQPVKVTFPGHDPFFDAVKGNNRDHALARAERNWPGAQIEPANWSDLGPALFDARRDLTARAQKAQPELTSRLSSIIKRVAGDNVSVAFPDEIPLPKSAQKAWGSVAEGKQTAAGKYVPAHNLIEVALHDPLYQSQESAAYHESFHAVERTLLNDNEMAVLRKAEPDLRKAVQDFAQLTPEQAKGLADYEVRAIAFEKYATDRDTGKPVTGFAPRVRMIFDRLANILGRVRNALNGMGFKTANDVFSDVYRGKVAERSRQDIGNRTEPQFSVNRNEDRTEPSRIAGYLRDKAQSVVDPLKEVARDLQMKTAPMAARDATVTSRATAKDFANALRLAHWQWAQIDKELKTNFKPDQLKRMWEAADAESVARQEGKPTEGIGLSTLPENERNLVKMLQDAAQNTWKQARDLGMVEGEGLPSYVPRMIVDMATGKPLRVNSQTGEGLSSGIGRNLKTSTPQMKGRNYLTAAETEAAAKAKFGEGAEIAKTLRSLPLATAKMQEAVAGRTLINKIKEIGKAAGDDTVVEGAEPANSPHKWFTIDHPAFKTWRPKLAVSEQTGKTSAVHDTNGNPVFEKVPIYVRSDFEGPLKAVLSRNSGKIYNALMDLKGKTMSLIMYSPIIHNAVEWGRALPAMPGKVATFRIYFEGNKAKHDPVQMREAIQAGMVPIGERAFNQDITSMMEDPTLKAGRSLTAKAIGSVADVFSEKAGDSVRRGIDKMGDIWHNKLLWDRVGDLQMGLYTNLRDHLIDKGMDRQSSARVAAHLANRYAGALPLESMSDMSRKIANFALFSRSFTLGNLGAMKDSINGLPRDVQAQIERDAGPQVLGQVKSYARRKAIGILLLDIGLMYAGNSILQDGINYLRGDQSLSDVEKGYVDRLHTLMQRLYEHPYEVLSPLTLAGGIAGGFAGGPAGAVAGAILGTGIGQLGKLSATHENEPDKQDRILVGYQKDGTAIYARNPTGKIGEEFTGYLTGPFDMVRRKLGTIARPLGQTMANDKGFGRKVYDPNASTPSEWAKNVGNIAWLFMSSQLPVDSAQAAHDLYTGQGDQKTNALKAFGPLAGVTFSKGAPGGPAIGELYKAEEKQRYRVQQALPDIRRMIQDGNVEGAQAKMQELNIPKGLQNYYIRTTINPAYRLSKRKMKDFGGYASPEEKARLERDLQQMVPAQP